MALVSRRVHNIIVYALFGAVMLAPVTGELWRLPVMGLRFLPSDLLIPVFLLAWGLFKLRFDRRARVGVGGKVFTLYLGALLITFFINAYGFGWRGMILAFSYLARYMIYGFLLFSASDIYRRDRKRFSHFFLLLCSVSLFLIVILGFLQLAFFPSFLELGLYLDGWDPHIGRLLSTWFDPNFIGGFLAFVLPPVIAAGIFARNRGRKYSLIFFSVVAVTGLIGLYLTFSRSGYLAFLAALGVLSLIKSRKVFLVALLVAVMAFGFSPRVRERTLDAWDSGKALLGLDSQIPLDPTARLRVRSWETGFEIAGDHFWTGIGFGRYAVEYNLRGQGLLSDHASGGSDSSVLTLWAVSGCFGVALFLATGFAFAVRGIKNTWKRRTFKSYLDAGLLAGCAGLMIHSVFVNSLFFPLILIYLMSGLGLIDGS